MREWKVIVLIGILSGCQSVVDLDLPDDFQSKLVIESIFSPDSLWRFHVGRSAPLGEDLVPSELIVPDAEIVIFSEDRRFRDTLRYINDGIYQTLHDHRPMSGARYNVQVNAPGFTQAEASSWAPPLHSELLEIKRMPNENFPGTERYSLRFRLVDRPGSNYYSLALYQITPYCEVDDEGGFTIEDGLGYWTDYGSISFESNSRSFRGAAEAVDDPTYPSTDNIFGIAFFSDQFFEATTVEFEIAFEPQIYESVRGYFMLTLTALSEDLFAHERSLEQHDLYVTGPNLTRSTPVVVYTNFHNGLGLFAGYTNNSYRFDENGNEWEEDVVGVGSGEIGPCHE